MAVKNGIACHTNQVANTREGYIVRLADKIAYINHDIDDAIRAGVLSEEDLPESCTNVLGHTKSKRITTLVNDIICNGAEEIRYSPDVKQAHDDLRNFLFAQVYTNPIAKSEESKAKGVVEKLYFYFLKNTDKLPAEYKKIMSRFDKDRAVCDYIAGMSDGYAIDLFSSLFVPFGWKP